MLSGLSERALYPSSAKTAAVVWQISAGVFPDMTTDAKLAEAGWPVWHPVLMSRVKNAVATIGQIAFLMGVKADCFMLSSRIGWFKVFYCPNRLKAEGHWRPGTQRLSIVFN